MNKTCSASSEQGTRVSHWKHRLPLLQDHWSAGEAVGQGQVKITQKLSYHFKLSFSWFSIYTVAVNPWLLSRVLTVGFNSLCLFFFWYFYARTEFGTAYPPFCWWHSDVFLLNALSLDILFPLSWMHFSSLPGKLSSSSNILPAPSLWNLLSITTCFYSLWVLPSELYACALLLQVQLFTHIHMFSPGWWTPWNSW